MSRKMSRDMEAAGYVKAVVAVKDALATQNFVLEGASPWVVNQQSISVTLWKYSINP